MEARLIRIDAPEPPRTFVLVHGAWHGAWCWRALEELLVARGHRVFTPTQTGLGERSHLMSRAITLDTFIDDVANLIVWEDLWDIVLVGHSFAGSTISGVADRMPERIGSLVYLDALLIESGQTPFSVLPAEVAAARRAAALASSGGMSVPPPPAAAFGVEDAAQAAWLEARMSAQPLSVFESELHLKHAPGNALPVTYVVCTAPLYAPLAASRAWVRARGWPVRELVAGHDAMVTAPDRLADLLCELALHGAPGA